MKLRHRNISRPNIRKDYLKPSLGSLKCRPTDSHVLFSSFSAFKGRPGSACWSASKKLSSAGAILSTAVSLGMRYDMKKNVSNMNFHSSVCAGCRVPKFGTGFEAKASNNGRNVCFDNKEHRFFAEMEKITTKGEIGILMPENQFFVHNEAKTREKIVDEICSISFSFVR